MTGSASGMWRASPQVAEAGSDLRPGGREPGPPKWRGRSRSSAWGSKERVGGGPVQETGDGQTLVFPLRREPDILVNDADVYTIRGSLGVNKEYLGGTME